MYDTMDAAELRAERERLHEQVCTFARQYREARLAGDFAREAGTGVALDTALAQVRRVERFLRLGVAA